VKTSDAVKSREFFSTRSGSSDRLGEGDLSHAFVGDPVFIRFKDDELFGTKTFERHFAPLGLESGEIHGLRDTQPFLPVEDPQEGNFVPRDNGYGVQIRYSEKGEFSRLDFILMNSGN
jgi:hypothetical protein